LLDKATNGQEKVTWTLRIDKTKVDEARIRLAKTNELSRDLDNLLNFMPPDAPNEVTKTILVLMKQIMFNSIMSIDVPVLYAVEYIEKRLATIEKIVAELTEDGKHPNLKAEIEELKLTINSEDFKTVRGFVDNMLKQIDEYNKKREENDLAT
jgi:hypothetical protein